MNKYIYLHVVQGNYDHAHGWEDLTQSENYKEARDNLKEYRENEPEYSHRMIRRRVLNTLEDIVIAVAKSAGFLKRDAYGPAARVKV